MNPSSEVWFIHLSVITAVQLQQMGWQGASWHHPAQTHTPMCTHTCKIYHLPHTHTHASVCQQTNSYTFICIHTYCLWSFRETEGKGEGGLKVYRERSSNVFLSVCLIWAFSACFIHSALSAGVWGPKCKHWVYKCFVLFVCLPSKPKKATGGDWKWRKGRMSIPEEMMMWRNQHCNLVKIRHDDFFVIIFFSSVFPNLFKRHICVYITNFDNVFQPNKFITKYVKQICIYCALLKGLSLGKSK